MTTTNRSLEVVGAIDAILEKECKHLDLKEDSDRAKMAWWIYQTFGEDDFITRAKARDLKRPASAQQTIKGTEKTKD